MVILVCKKPLQLRRGFLSLVNAVSDYRFRLFLMASIFSSAAFVQRS